MICANCGREMPDTDRYCGICGTLNPLLENAAPAQESPDPPVQEHAEDTPVSEEPPAQEYTAGIQTNVARVQGYTPYPQANGVPAPEYRPFDPNLTQPPEKVKRTCSLSVVIFCGVVIFLLSIACGVLAGLYLSEKTATRAHYSATEYENG